MPKVKVMVREGIRRATPWWAKAGLKLALVKAPVGYTVLRAVGLARHGGMEEPAFAFDAFHRHFDNVEFRNKSGGFSMLELGPGDSLFNAIIGRAYGARSITLLDVGYFANTDVRLYREMADFLRGRGLDAPDLSSARTVDDMLAACNARYETRGLESLRALPEASFDFIFSNGVLQAVWRKDVPETMRQIRRLVAPGGNTIHSADLRDMVGQSLHHLRFDERRWESDWFRNAGLYTNRLRVSEIERLAREAGFEPRLDEVNRWPAIPVPRHKLHPSFRDMSDDDLTIATIRIALTPAGDVAAAADESSEREPEAVTA